MTEFNPISSVFQIVPRQSPGIALMIIAAVILYMTAFFSNTDPLITRSGVGLAFVAAVGGITLLYRATLGQTGVQEAASMAVASSDVEEAVRQLGKNYDILRRQATQGFILAGTFMAMGIMVILTGSLGEMFGFTKAASNLTTIAGVVVEAVSGLGLYLFKETFKQLNSTSDQLYGMWKILAALKKSDDLPDVQRAEVVISLIYKLVGIDKVATIPAAAAPAQALPN